MDVRIHFAFAIGAGIVATLLFAWLFLSYPDVKRGLRRDALSTLAKTVASALCLGVMFFLLILWLPTVFDIGRGNPDEKKKPAPSVNPGARPSQQRWYR